MIIKSASRKRGSYRQLLRYMIEGEERVPESRIILHNVIGETLDDWVAEFKANEANRKRERKGSVKLYHDILSFHPDDTSYLTLNTIEELTRNYIEERNPNGLYVGAIHLADDHYHCHLCISGTEYKSGKSLRISKARFKAIKLNVQTIEQTRFPELHYSPVAHGSGSNKHRVYEKNRRAIRKEVLQISQSATSAQDFLTKLKASEHEIYYRQGKPTGVVYNGQKLRFKNIGLSKDKIRYLSRSPSLEKEL